MTCTICERSDVREIDAALRRGVSIRQLVKLFPGLSKSAIHRHRQRCLAPRVEPVRVNIGEPEPSLPPAPEPPALPVAARPAGLPEARVLGVDLADLIELLKGRLADSDALRGGSVPIAVVETLRRCLELALKVQIAAEQSHDAAALRQGLTVIIERPEAREEGHGEAPEAEPDPFVEPEPEDAPTPRDDARPGSRIVNLPERDAPGEGMPKLANGRLDLGAIADAGGWPGRPW